MKKGLMIAAAGALLLALAAGGYQYYRSQREEQATVVEVSEVQRRDLISKVLATGTLRPVESVDVSSKITARIKTVLVKENERVREGQVVATLDGKDYEARCEQARFKVRNEQSKYDRISYLYQIGANTQEEYEDALYRYETALSNLEVTESELAETVITAPMSGTVVGEPQTPGTMAVQGTSNPTVIMRIADLSRKEIRAKVDETDIGNIRVGQEVSFTVNAFPQRRFAARVARIAPTDVTDSWSASSTAAISVVYYYVTLDVEDEENLLMPGMTAQVEIVTATRPGALALPLAALRTKGDRTYVMLQGVDGATTEQQVATGIYTGEYVEILEGLQEGDKVANTYNLKKPTRSLRFGRP